MKKYLAILLVMVLSLVLVACKLDEPEPDKPDPVIVPTSVIIVSSKLQIDIDEELNLSANVLPANAPQEVEWTSNTPAVATVDATGKVKGIAAGTVEIVANSKTAPTVKRSVTLTVIDPTPVVPTPVSIVITAPTLELEVEGDVTLTAVVLPAGAPQEVVWSSSDLNKATVDAEGKVTAVGLGTFVITATSATNGNVLQTITIEVVEEPVPVPVSVEIVDPTTTTLEIGDELVLSASVLPADAPQELTWTSSHPARATVDQEGKVTAILGGTVTITAKSTTNVAVLATITIQVLFTAPDSVALSATGGSLEVTVDSIIVLKATVLPATASQAVTFSSSDESIATVGNGVDAGKVTGIATGTVFITVVVNANEELTDTYPVTVIPKIDDTYEELDPTSVVIQGSNSVIEGRKIHLIASVRPAGVSQNVFWSSLNPSVATINQITGEVTGVTPGVVYIQAVSAKDLSIMGIFVLTVKVKPADEPAPNMFGYEILVMHAPHVPHEHNPFHAGYVGLDKTAKQDAINEISASFNVKFKFVPYPAEAPWGPARTAWLNAKAALGQAETDIFVSTTDWLKVIADGNSAVDTTQYYEDYGLNIMNASLKGASTYQGKLFALPSAMVASIYVDKGLFYNVELVESLNLESPAKLFNEGRWTYAGFTDYVKAATAELGEGQSVLAGRAAQYYLGMVNAGGVSLADPIELQMNFNHPYAIQAANILRDLYLTEKGWGTMAWDDQATSFNEGNSIFQSAEYWFLHTENRFKSTLWDENGNSRYGYVPYPYPNNLSKEDTRTVGAGGACYMMANGRAWNYTNGVTERMVYRAFATMMIRTEELMTEDITYDEDTLMRSYARTKLDDEESVYAIVFFKRDKVVFDPLYGLISVHTGIGPALDQIVRDGYDYTAVLDALAPSYLQVLMDIYG